MKFNQLGKTGMQVSRMARFIIGASNVVQLASNIGRLHVELAYEILKKIDSQL